MCSQHACMMQTRAGASRTHGGAAGAPQSVQAAQAASYLRIAEGWVRWPGREPRVSRDGSLSRTQNDCLGCAGRLDRPQALRDGLLPSGPGAGHLKHAPKSSQNEAALQGGATTRRQTSCPRRQSRWPPGYSGKVHRMLETASMSRLNSWRRAPWCQKCVTPAGTQQARQARKVDVESGSHRTYVQWDRVTDHLPLAQHDVDVGIGARAIVVSAGEEQSRLAACLGSTPLKATLPKSRRGVSTMHPGKATLQCPGHMPHN